MLIPLSDEIWKRLYGPYGVQNVGESLMQLDIAWDVEIARDLYWEKLHHQYDLYPVTYAAMPWLWAIHEKRTDVDLGSLVFFAHVIACACSPTGHHPTAAQTAQLAGLSLQVVDHAKGWLPADTHLTSADMAILRALEKWFIDHAPTMAQNCVEAISDQGAATVAALASGFLCLKGALAANELLTLWGDGYDAETARAEVSLGQNDKAALLELLRKTGNRNLDLLAFIQEAADLELAPTGHPDLFASR